MKVFSAASRRRLLEKFHSLDSRAIDCKPLYITLTYPAVWPDSAASWKTQLELLWKWIERHRPNASMIWRLESQERGAPHFHLMVFGARYIEVDALAAEWYRVVGSGDPNHLKQGVHIRQCDDWQQAGKYTAKYCAKVDTRVLLVPWGRFWGLKGRANLPVSVTVAKLSEHEYFAVRRLLRRFLSHRLRRNVHCRGDCGLWVFLPWEAAITAISQVLRYSEAEERTAVFEYAGIALPYDLPDA